MLYNTSAPAFELTGGYTFLANPSVEDVTFIEGAEHYYFMAVSDLRSTNSFTLLGAEETLTLKPFEAVIAVKNVIEADLYGTIGTGKSQSGLPGICADDPVVLEKYYTLQGVEVLKPESNGIYLVKRIYASQRTTISKELK